MRGFLPCLIACASTTPATPTDRQEPTEGSHVEADPPSPSASARCPRRPLAIGEMPFDAPPTFSRELWLDVAISMADVVIVGQIDTHAEMLCGDVTRFVAERGRLHPLHAETSGEGVWMLVRAPAGYLVLNPELVPIARAEWDALVDRSVPRSEPPTEEHASSHQIYRTIQHEGERVWHGVEISGVGGDKHVVLYERGESLARIAFDSHGLERVVFKPPTGRGFMLQNAHGALWRYEHYLDGQLHGRSQTFERGSDRLRSESHYDDGRMHGRVRRWEDGRVTYDVTYERGLIAPVVPAPNPSDHAQIHYGPDGDVSYSAPHDVMDAIRARDVARLLGLPISPAMGVRFPSYRCEDALTIRFRNGRVSAREILPNGAHCLL